MVSLLFKIIMTITWIGLVAGMPSGIVIAILATFEKDEILKSRLKRLSWLLVLLPLGLLSIFGLAHGFYNAI